MKPVALAALVLAAAMSSPAATAQVRPAPSCERAAPSCIEAGLVFGLAAAPDARHLYALSWEPGDDPGGRLVGWSIGPAGALNHRSPVACVEQPSRASRTGCRPMPAWPRRESTEDLPGPDWGSIVVSADGRHVYVAGFNAIVAFTRDPSTGALQPLPDAGGCVARTPLGPGCARARGIRGAGQLVLSPDGRNAYVTSRGSRTWGVAAFARDPSTGALTQLPREAGCVSGGLRGCARGRQLNLPEDLEIAPDGRHLYVATGRASVLDAFGQGPGGGIAVLARDPRTGQLSQPAGGRGCINRRGTRGCRRDRRIGMRERLAVAPDGRSLYSINAYREEGPRVSPIAPDGSLRRSTGAGPYPDVATGLDAIAVADDGRLYAHSSMPGVFVYAPSRARSGPRLVECWTGGFAPAPCRRDDALTLGPPGLLAPTPAAVYFTGEGISSFVPDSGG